MHYRNEHSHRRAYVFLTVMKIKLQKLMVIKTGFKFAKQEFYFFPFEFNVKYRHVVRFTIYKLHLHINTRQTSNKARTGFDRITPQRQKE